MSESQTTPIRRSLPEEAQDITDAFVRGWPLPDPAGETSTEARGRVVMIAGAVEMPGAAILASEAALRAGPGRCAWQRRNQ